METLVVAQYQSHEYYSRNSSRGSGRFGSSPSSGFREISCRTFQSGAGILPNPFESFNSISSVTSKACSSPRTYKSANPNCDEDRYFRSPGTSPPIAINSNISIKDRSFSDDFNNYELWAGPAYSNSPPPSSLPIPKFSLRQKRSLSIELAAPSSPEITMRQFAKSAPPSPTRESFPSAGRSFSLSTASATRDLRRILHLDIGDE